MKKTLLIIFSVVCFGTWANANTGDTTIIIAHTHTNLASPPTDYDVWNVFPNTSVTYQKVIMRFTLGCGTPGCSHWDYTVNAEIGKKSGTTDSSIVTIDTLAHDTTWNYTPHVNYIELGRLITPYGTYMDLGQNGFNNNWTQPFYYDVTDYAQFLKDSVAVRVHYDGWSDAFSAKVEFIFIEGPPNRDVENVQEIYHKYVGYANSSDFESQVTPQTFYITPTTTSAKVIVDMTGHGSQGEFDPHYFHIKVNGTEVYSHILWKDDCDVNPVSPQGGTWVFHRANWCPGDKVPIYEIDITPYITPGQNISVDLDLDDFVIQSGQGAGYGISAHLITYSTQRNNDVMMEEVLSPNSDKPYLHWNPTCTNPKVKIRNTGKLPLTYAEISYWVPGGSKWYYEWHGNLPPFESELVTLPAFDWNGLDTTNKIFVAEANWPNQVPDEYTYNNHLEVAFNMPPKLDTIFYLQFKSNNQPWEDSYVLRNEAGDTMYAKNTFNASSVYRDTFRLVPGSYIFDFYDIDTVTWGCGDGLQFFVNQPPNAATTDAWYETTGQLMMRKITNTIIKTFNPDFGSNVHYEFTVGYPLGYNPPKPVPVAPVHVTGIQETKEELVANMDVYPNPANDMINVKADLSKDATGMITVTDITGRVMREYEFTNASYQHLQIPVKELSRGMYLVSLITEGTHMSKKIILQ